MNMRNIFTFGIFFLTSVVIYTESFQDWQNQGYKPCHENCRFGASLAPEDAIEKCSNPNCTCLPDHNQPHSTGTCWDTRNRGRVRSTSRPASV